MAHGVRKLQLKNYVRAANFIQSALQIKCTAGQSSVSSHNESEKQSSDNWGKEPPPSAFSTSGRSRILGNICTTIYEKVHSLAIILLYFTEKHCPLFIISSSFVKKNVFQLDTLRCLTYEDFILAYATFVNVFQLCLNSAVSLSLINELNIFSFTNTHSRIFVYERHYENFRKTN